MLKANKFFQVTETIFYRLNKPFDVNGKSRNLNIRSWKFGSSESLRNVLPLT